MTDKKSSESRRRLLIKMAIGGASIATGKSLPTEWTKPVIDSVILPVHAQTSPPISPPISPPSLSVTCTKVDPLGATMPQDFGQVNVIGNVNPIPTSDYTVNYYLTCNGTHHDSSPQSLPWPAGVDIGAVGAGTPTTPYPAPIDGLCPVGATYATGFEVQGATGECSWTITPPS